MNKYHWMILLWVTFPVSIIIFFLLWVLGVWLTRNSGNPLVFSDFVNGFKYWYLRH